MLDFSDYNIIELLIKSLRYCAKNSACILLSDELDQFLLDCLARFCNSLVKSMFSNLDPPEWMISINLKSSLLFLFGC